MRDFPSLADCAYAYDKPESSGLLKTQPADFVVEETLSFDLSGQGEHLYLQVQKTDSNTEWVARQLAKFYQVKPMDIGYAGLKDKNAITTQWFSVYLAGKGFPDITGLDNPHFQILQQQRHDKKLRRGAIKHNHFKMVLRDVTQPDTLAARIQQVSQNGVPNYFGQQRFGHKENNLVQAQQHFKNPKKRLPRFKRQLYLSAARAFLFNQLLSQRIILGNWQQGLRGDVLQLANTHSVFRVDALDDELQQRILSKDLQPTGILAGKTKADFVLEDSPAQQISQAVLALYPDFTAGLENAGLQAAYRAFSVLPTDVQWQVDVEQQQLQLAFNLVAGAYATSVLREIICV